MSDDNRARAGDHAITGDGLVHEVYRDFYGGTTTRCSPVQYVKLEKTTRVLTCVPCAAQCVR